MNWRGSCKPEKMSFAHNFKNLPPCYTAKSLSPEPVSQSLHFTNEFMMGMNKNAHKHAHVNAPSARSVVTPLLADSSGGNPCKIIVPGPFLAGS